MKIPSKVNVAPEAKQSGAGAEVTALAESMQAELGPEGFFFNTLCLGAVQTEMLAEAFPDYQASTSPKMMGLAVANFALNGHQTQAGQVIPMTKSNP